MTGTTKVLIGSRGGYKLVNAAGVTVGGHMPRPETATRQTRSTRADPATVVQKQQLGLGGTGAPQQNPLADTPNWGTGGRNTSPAASGADPSRTWLYIGGAVVLFMLFRKKK